MNEDLTKKFDKITIIKHVATQLDLMYQFKGEVSTGDIVSIANNMERAGMSYLEAVEAIKHVIAFVDDSISPVIEEAIKLESEEYKAVTTAFDDKFDWPNTKQKLDELSVFITKKD